MKHLLFLILLLTAQQGLAQTILQKSTIKETPSETLIELHADQPLNYQAKAESSPPTILLRFEKTALDPKFKAFIENETIRSLTWNKNEDAAEVRLELEVDAPKTLTLSADKKTLTIKIARQQSKDTPPDVRISVQYHIKKASISFNGDILLTDQEKSKELDELKGEYKVSTKKGKVILSQKGKVRFTATSLLLSPKDPSATFLSANKTVYRGALRLIAHDDGTFSVINVLDMESYLLGVVSREMPASWPQEALSAQAIAARTYALQRTGQYGDVEPFDLYDTTADQVYGGKSSEQKASTLAVNQTRGIAAYDLDGALINALYFSTAGGCTENNDAVFEQEALPYLRSTKTDWDAESPNFSWTISFTKKELEEKLNKKAETKIGTLTKIVLREQTTAGRWTWVDLEGSDGKKTVRGHQFRRALGAGKLKSTLFTMTEAEGTYTFEGKGYGHGVGMCQYSAKGMATAGYNHRFILRTFYGQSMRLQVVY